MLKILNNNKFLLLLLLVYLIDPVALFMLFKGISLPDFRSYYAAGLLLGNGTLYNPGLLSQTALAAGESLNTYPYLYPPLLAHLMQPLTLLSPIAASVLFLIINTVLAFLLLLCCYLGIVKPYLKSSQALWPMVLVVLMLPLHGNLQMGQINIVVLAAVVFSLLAANRWPLVSGLAFNIAALIKMTPIGFLGLLLVQRRFLLFFQWLLLGLTLLALLVVVETGNWLEFFSFLKHAAIQPPDVLTHDIEVYGFSWRTTLQRLALSGEVAFWLRLASLLLAALLLLPLGFLLAANNKNLWLLYLPFSIVMVLASPIAYTHHVIYLLPGALAWAYYLKSSPSRLPLLCFFILLFISGLDFPLWLSGQTHWPVLLRSINFFALALLFLFTVYWLGRNRDALSH